jgi:hypothetical protein
MDPDFALKSKFITSFCQYIEKEYENNENFKTALESLKKTEEFEEAQTIVPSVFETFKAAEQKRKTFDQFMDFPLNISFDTVFSNSLNF